MVSESAAALLPSNLAELPDGWTYQPLAALLDQQRGICYGIVQPGSATVDGVPIIRVNNIRHGRIDTTDVLRVAPEIEAEFRRSRLRGGEVLLTLVGSLGESAIVPKELEGWNIARAVGVIPVCPKIGARWVEMCLRSATIQHHISMWATTTVQATLNLRDVAKLPIPIPPKREREQITKVIGTLDDKIELNRRMNETLEGMARALFKSWFDDCLQFVFTYFRDVRNDAGHPTGIFFKRDRVHSHLVICPYYLRVMYDLIDWLNANKPI